MESQELNNAQTVKHYPTLGLAWLNSSLEAAGRVYLLAQHIDQAGRGAVSLDLLREQLTRKDSRLRIFGWRRLRQVVNEGEGIFWTRGGGRLWLYSPARVATALSCGRLRGLPVALPIDHLLDGIQQARAAFFAAWHTGMGGKERPISQATIRRLTGVSEASQRRYNKAAGVKAERQYAVFNADKDTTKETAYKRYKRGAASFDFQDIKGLRGKRASWMIAWHMPSIYKTCYNQAPKGRQKKHNRRIDLVNKGTRGNDSDFVRIYHLDGARAGKAYNRNPGTDAYFPEAGLWGVMVAQ